MTAENNRNKNLRLKVKSGIFGRFPHGIWVMTGVDILLTIGFSISIPFLALYLHDERQISMSLVGMLFLISGIVTALANLIGGVLADHFGRRKTVIMMSCFAVFAHAGLAVLIALGAEVWLIFTAYIVARGIIGMMQPAESAIIADVAPKERLTESYAFVRVGGNIGFALGPAMGGYLLTFLSYAWLIGIAALTCGLVALLVLLQLHETFQGSSERADIRTTLAVARDHRFLIFSLFSLLLFASMAQLGSTLSVFSVDRLAFTTTQYGLLLTTNGIIVALFQYPVAIWMNNFPRDRGLILGSVLYAIGYASFGWVKSFDWGLVSMAVITAGEITFSPIASSVVAESAPFNWRGRYMGFAGLSQTVGVSFAPLFGGVLLDAFPREPRLLWGLIGLVGLIPAFGFVWWGRKKFKPSPLIDR